MTDTAILTVFFTGLTTGGLSCLAIQGGLLTTLLTGSKSTKDKYLSVFIFLLFKILSHTLFGLLLGYLGSFLVLPSDVRGWLQIIIALYIFGVAANLLNFHPLFRYFSLKPPKFALRLARNTSKNTSLISAGFLGALTILIPCATTQAMSVLALSTSDPLYASAIMTAFTLGTIPSFLIFGFVVTQFSRFRQIFTPLSAVVLFTLSIYSLNGGLTLIDSPYTLQNFYYVLTKPISQSHIQFAPLVSGYQQVTISVTNSGYTADYMYLRQDIPTKLILHTNNTQSCTRSFVIPSLKISKLLDSTGQDEIIFTPDKPGVIGFTCSMGMYSGQITVI